MLDLITRKLPADASILLDRVLDMDEVEAVVKGFSKEKAPGLDGLIVEVLLGC